MTPTFNWFHVGVANLLHPRAPTALNPNVVIPDLRVEFPDSDQWLPKFLLNAGIRSRLDPGTRALFLAVVRRGSHALGHYLAARSHTLTFAAWDGKGSLPASTFFGAVREWENCLLQYQFLVEVLNQSGRGVSGWRAYESGDGSATERMCLLANRVKHPSRKDVTPDRLTPLWLESEGLAGLDGYAIGYVDLAAELSAACGLAERFVDPATLFPASTDDEVDKDDGGGPQTTEGEAEG